MVLWGLKGCRMLGENLCTPRCLKRGRLLVEIKGSFLNGASLKWKTAALSAESRAAYPGHQSSSRGGRVNPCDLPCWVEGQPVNGSLIELSRAHRPGLLALVFCVCRGPVSRASGPPCGHALQGTPVPNGLSHLPQWESFLSFLFFGFKI